MPSACARRATAPAAKVVSVPETGLRLSHSEGGWQVHSDRSVVSLPAYATARIAGSWHSGDTDLVVVSGSGPGCAKLWTAVSFSPLAISEDTVPECGHDLNWTERGKMLYARRPDERSTWLFRNGRIHPLAARKTTAQILRDALGPYTSLPATSTPIGNDVVPGPVSENAAPHPKP